MAKQQVIITWMHGDADSKTKEAYEVNIQDFLEFIFKYRKGVNFNHFTGFLDNSLSNEELYELYKEFPQFEDMIPYDQSCDSYHPTVDDMHVKIGKKKKNIIWQDFSDIAEQKIDIPEIGSVFNTNSGKINHLYAFFNKKQKECLHYSDLNKMGLGEQKHESYTPLKTKVLKSEIDLQRSRGYYFDFKRLSVNLLLEMDGLEGKFLTTTINSVSTRNVKINEEEVYLFKSKSGLIK